MQPSIDAVITTCNRPHFITSALESVMKQTYRINKIIIIDDGSEPHTNQTISKFLKSEKSYIRKNRIITKYVYIRGKGISAARNAGIKLSSADYIAFLDDDDIWKKKKIEKQINALVKCGWSACYTDEEWLMNGKHINQLKKHSKYSGNIFEKTLPLCIISPSSIIIKREIFYKTGLFDENFEVCEDYEYWLRLSLDYPIFFLPEKLIVKNGGHVSQLSRRHPSMDRFRIQAIEKLLNERSLKEPEYSAAVSELQTKLHIYITGCIKRGKENEAEQYKLLVKKYNSKNRAS